MTLVDGVARSQLAISCWLVVLPGHSVTLVVD